tara:strand:+ start:1643 stop:2026 length:384 start_codon:yes stop_codon:yes gene_type:complete
MGILELIAGVIIGLSIATFNDEPNPRAVYPNDSTRVSQAYYNVYYDVHFRNSYSDPYWNRGYYYGVNYYVDTPKYVYVKSKKKRSGEYRRTRTNNDGNKGGYRGGGKGGNRGDGGKSRGGRRATRRE